MENRVVCYKGGAAMKIFLSVIIIFMVGLCAMVFGIEQFGGYPELGTVVEIAVVPSRFMRKIVCRLRLSEVSRQ